MNLHAIGQSLADLLGNVSDQALTVLAYPFTTGNSLHIAYLATSVLLAAWVYHRTKSRDDTTSSLLGYLFPKAIWRTPSAWLDVRYFFVDQVLTLLTYSGILVAIAASAYQLSNPWFQNLFGSVAITSELHPVVIGIIFNLVVIAALDFLDFFLHYLQHKVPLLWEFHKVHHSAPVLHPLTAFRIHPVEKITSAALRGLSVGIMGSGTFAILGYVPSAPLLFGISATALLYDLLGRNLRHSHIWLRWPGRLNYLLSAPAHHQIHHSANPDHIDKNFAVMFPLWDIIFDTYVHPTSNKDIQFGLGESDRKEFNSCLDLYLVPFKNSAKLLRQGFTKPNSELL